MVSQQQIDQVLDAIRPLIEQRVREIRQKAKRVRPTPEIADQARDLCLHYRRIGRPIKYAKALQIAIQRRRKNPVRYARRRYGGPTISDAEVFDRAKEYCMRERAAGRPMTMTAAARLVRESEAIA